ncbi:hypothetical protein Q2T40_14100 [Winogradskyella maritima]|uniref:Glycosyltransferase involved in cell wall biosynthesis n=1 Tax=Winogradskyella maritima TaxID=1517766 RepID=A0ABV8AGV9_9FLAO|nr:hypothetical protein [Winogradskyella maritima]
MNKHLHIVAFDNPYPPNYGGAIDVFYKIKGLYESGIHIHLHIFIKERRDLLPLEDYCKNVYSYPQKSAFSAVFSRLPIRLMVRENKTLFQRLKKTNDPILFEGLHTTHSLNVQDLKSKILVRTHNIEHDYMQGLAESSSSFIRKFIYKFEARKLKAYEPILNKTDHILALSHNDSDYFESQYDAKVSLLPVCHGFEKVTSNEGFGKYAIFHGDLTTADNIKAVEFLIEVFAGLDFPLKIAGSDLPKALEYKIERQSNVSLERIANRDQLTSLISEAHINVLYSFQESGTKLKVFYALYQGRHCIVNSNIIDDKQILGLCEIAENVTDYRAKVQSLMGKEFILTSERKEVLERYKTSVIIEDLVEILNE